MRYLALVAALVFSVQALATPVGPMNFQGRLVDDSGVPVTGTYDFRIQVYDASVSGNQEYYEEHVSVFVDDGVYDLQIGTGTSVVGEWTVEMWQGDFTDNSLNRFLQIQVDDGGGFETLTPRHELTSAPHAFSATLALSAESLGAKTAAEFDNILEGVCVASKGKWLDKVEKCLGRGASFPGPSMTLWSDLATTNDFRNLDLSDADISGIDFSGAILQYSVFTNTTYQLAGLNGVNIRDTEWDGAVATDASPINLASNTYIRDAKFSNMDMSKWNISALTSTYYRMFSAAYLSACPAGLPSYWECRLMRSSGSDYFLLGHFANLSTTSAASTVQRGVTVLDVDYDALANIELKYASLVGNTVSADFTDTNFYQADLSYTNISGSIFANTWLSGTDFVGATIVNSVFASDVFWSNPDFTDGTLERVNIAGTLAGGIFNGATLKQVDFETVGASKFVGAVLENVRISNLIYSNAVPYHTDFDQAVFYGEFHIEGYSNGSNTMYLNDMTFNGVTFSGDLTHTYDATFTGTNVFNRVHFTDIDMAGVTIPVTSTAPHPELANVTWGPNVICPNGYVTVSGGGPGDSDGCDYSTRMTP